MANLNIPIESPGVVIREFDRSQSLNLAGATTILLNGFTPQGPTDEPTFLNSISQFEEIFGIPKTDAEGYAYNAAKQILTTSAANLIFTRLPYGEGAGIGYAAEYTALVYPVVGLSATEISPCDYYTALTDADVVKERHPYLYSDYFLKECIGSQNLYCSIDATDFVGAGSIYVVNYPVQKNGSVTSFKFTYYVDNAAANDVTILHLASNDDGTYTQISDYPLSFFNYSSLSEVGEDSEGLKEIEVSSSGLIDSISVSAGDVFAISATDDSFGFYYTVSGKGLSVAEISSGSFSVVEDAAAIDIQFSICYQQDGISCEEVTSLGLTVPEKYRYTFAPVGGECQLRDANYYVLGDPVLKELNESQYELLKNRQFDWQCGCFSNVDAALELAENDVRAGIVVVNEKKTALDDNFAGYYVAITDNFNVNPATDFNEITAVCGEYDTSCVGVTGGGGWTPVPQERLNFPVSEAYDSDLGSISSIIEQSAGVDFATDAYRDSITVSLFKLRPTTFTESVLKLDYVLSEKFVGSLNEDRKINNPDGGRPRSFFIEDAINNNSNTLTMFVNPFLSGNNCWNNNKGLPVKSVRSFRQALGGVFDANFDGYAVLQRYADNLYSVNAQTSGCVDQRLESCKTKDIGSLPLKLERALRNVQNPDVFDPDIVVDGGLSTIWATRQAVKDNACLGDVSVCYNYDSRVFVDTNSLSPYDGSVITSNLRTGWEIITNTFINHVQLSSGALGSSSLFISDPLRQIFVNGENYKVVDRQKKLMLDPKTGEVLERYSTFSRNIFAYLRNLYSGVDTSFGAAYGNWIEEYDGYRDKVTWQPMSSYMAAMMARIDSNSYPWIPPFGPNNGSFNAGGDLAINPNQKERDLLYRIGINPIVRDPSYGKVAMSNQTLQKVDSALSKINVRRLLIAVQKPTRTTLFRFIGEPNDIITRTRVVASLTPIFEEAKQNRGLYDYKIICDDSNNTPDDIDNGVLKVAIYLKPVKGVEFILADFFITNTKVDFSELI